MTYLYKTTQMEFKFLNTIDTTLEDIQHNLNQVEQEYPNDINSCNIYFRDSRDRNSISEEEWNHILQLQRRRLIELLFTQGHVVHEIVYQDNIGYTMETRIRI
jgi:predicted DNA-binding transcriptional regulator